MPLTVQDWRSSEDRRASLREALNNVAIKEALDTIVHAFRPGCPVLPIIPFTMSPELAHAYYNGFLAGVFKATDMLQNLPAIVDVPRQSAPAGTEGSAQAW